jgi:hypothetical protein
MLAPQASGLTTVAAAAILVAASGPLLAADVPQLDLKFGVLAGLSGDLAQSGQPWTEAVRLAVQDVSDQVKSWGYDGKIKVTFLGAEDSQGNAQSGIEAAKKLVDVEGANIVIGDFFSSVTVAAAQSVFIPEQIIDFTGGTAGSITDLNKSTGQTWVWRLPPPDTIQGPVAAKLVSDTLGAGKTLNVAARNDTYGVGLLASFKKAWTDARQDRRRRRLQSRLADPRHRGPADRRGQPGRLVHRRLLRRLGQAQRAAATRGQLGSQEDVRRRRARRMPEAQRDDCRHAQHSRQRFRRWLG